MTRRDPVTPDIYRRVLERDHGCVMADHCGADPALCSIHLELDHIDSLGFNLRGPSTLDNLVSVCSFHHKLKTEHAAYWRPLLRGYIAKARNQHDIWHIDAWREPGCAWCA